MQHIYLYHSRTNYEAAEAFTAELRARDDVALVSPARSDRWEGETLGDVVYHDGSSRALVWAHEEAGVPCKLFGESATQVERAPTEVAIEAPKAEEPDEGEDLPDGYHIEQSGPWHTVIGPDGEKVGKSHRTEEAAVEAAQAHG